MNKRRCFLLALVVLVAGARPWQVECYEDLTHKALTQQALKVAADNDSSIPPELRPPQGDLAKQLMAGAGEGPGGRGGGAALKTDGEDYTSYRIHGCPVRVSPYVWRVEPFHHFRDSVLLASPAHVKFLQFYADAVELWRKDERAKAAFVLGRAVHLVEVMGQPQHALQEMHLPLFEPFQIMSGGSPSFLEEYSEANIRGATEGQFCANSSEPYAQRIAEINQYYAVPACNPGIALLMNARNSQDKGGEFKGMALNINEINRLYGASVPEFCQGGVECELFLPFQDATAGCRKQAYIPSFDFSVVGPRSAFTQRVDLGMKVTEARMNAEGAGPFLTYHADTYLSPTVGWAAGVITAFWNEVKDSCGGSSAKESSGTCLVCLTDRPSGESPDDSVAVKASSRPETGTVPASDDWHDVCRVGIEKGLASMAAYGVSSSLMEQLAALDPNTDPTGAQALYARLETLEAKYAGPQNRMPQDVASAPEVAVWDKGFGGSARSLVEAMREPVAVLEEPQEPVFTDEEALSLLPPGRGLLEADPAKQKILVLPTGSLYGLRADSTEAQALKGFVEGGGVAVSFTQPYGDDFTALPVPAGQSLLAAGFKGSLSPLPNG